MSIEEMKAVDVRSVKLEELVDIQDTRINKRLAGSKRVADYIKQIKNPYCYRQGEYIVKIGFTDTTVNITERLKEIIYKTSNSDMKL